MLTCPLVGSFPCTRWTPLDAFKEGEFDYPYALKQVDRIAPFIYEFLTASYFESSLAASGCIDSTVNVPIKQGAISRMGS